MLSEVQSKCGVRGRTKLHEGVNDEREQEPQGGEADRPQNRRKGGLTSTPTIGSSNCRRREVGGGK